MQQCHSEAQAEGSLADARTDLPSGKVGDSSA